MTDTTNTTLRALHDEIAHLSEVIREVAAWPAAEQDQLTDEYLTRLIARRDAALRILDVLDHKKPHLTTLLIRRA